MEANILPEARGASDAFLDERSLHQEPEMMDNDDIEANETSASSPFTVVDDNGKVLPLESPDMQIRLFRLHPGGDEDPINGDLQVFDRSTAPPYLAISYMWGSEESPESIIVNGFTKEVRANCAYALWLARYHRAPELNFVWIDTLCINQQDLAEKNVQVNVMYQIYCQASLVLGCVGKSDPSSEFMFDVFDDLEFFIELFDGLIENGIFKGRTVARLPTGKHLALQGINDAYHNFWDRTSDFLDQLEKHWVIFSRRPYFNRTWIVQELHGGGAGTRIACGKRSVKFVHVLEFDIYLYDRLNGSKWEFKWSAITSIREKVGARDSDDFEIENILFSAGECEDPRDQLYANLHLLDWARFGVQRPMPDYTIPLWDLALQTLGILSDPSICEAETVARAFKLPSDFSFLSQKTESSDRAGAGAHRRSWNFYRHGISLLAQNDSGCLTADLIHDGSNEGLINDSPDSGAVRRALARQYNEAASLAFGGESPLEVRTGLHQSAFVCRQTLPGDLLVSTSDLGHFGHFVLRQSQEVNTFSFVGRAMLVNGYRCRDKRDWKCPCVSLLGREGVARLSCEMSVDMSITEALCVGAFSDSLFFAITQEEIIDIHLRFASLRFPEHGAVIKDVTLRDWSDECKLMPLGKTCPEHSRLDYSGLARHPLQYALKTQVGGEVPYEWYKGSSCLCYTGK